MFKQEGEHPRPLNSNYLTWSQFCFHNRVLRLVNVKGKPTYRTVHKNAALQEFLPYDGRLVNMILWLLPASASLVRTSADTYKKKALRFVLPRPRSRLKFIKC